MALHQVTLLADMMAKQMGSHLSHFIYTALYNGNCETVLYAENGFSEW